MFNGKLISVLLTSMCSLLLFSCQSTTSESTQSVQVNQSLFVDEIFQDYRKYPIETEEEIFAIDDQMKALVSDYLIPERNIKRRASKLLRHIFSKNNVNLAYQSGANLTAIDAYHKQTANCLSLTIMAYALAKEAKLDVNFQDVKVPEYWIRNGEYNMLTGHVNLMIVQPRTPNKIVVFGNDVLQIDFDPFVVKKSFPKKVVDKSTVIAMFYNNKGAQALVEHNYSQAYAYFKAATKVAPGFSSGWGNLGILYKFVDQVDLAVKTYRYAISLDDENLTALTNLSLTLKTQGKYAEVKEIEKQLHDKRIKNPYYHALLADEAFYRGDIEKAKSHYLKAIRMDKKAHEFYFGIAKVYYAMNHIEKAERAMKKALLYNRASSTESQYLAKLNFLRQAIVNE